MDNRCSAAILASLLACCGMQTFAGDIVVARGETLDLSADTVCGTVTVSGTLNIPAGIALTADILELGPNEGDMAVVNVIGSSGTGLNVVNSVNVGSSGGCGQIVALSPAETHNTGWDKVVVAKLGNVCISENAAVSPSGFVDFLKLGPGTVDFITMANASGARARILTGNGCVGYSQNWGKIMFSGPFQVESFDGGDIRFGCDYGQRILNSGSLVVKGNGRDVYFCRYVDATAQFYSLRDGLVWDSVRDIVLTERHPLKVETGNLLPHGPSAGVFRIANGDATQWSTLDIGATVQYLNSFSSDSPVADVSLIGSPGGKIVFGDGDTDGFLKGRIQEDIDVVKVGNGVFSVTNESMAGSMTVSGGTLRVAAAFGLDELTVSSGATLEIDGVVLAPSSGRAIVEGGLVLKNGGRLVTSESVSEDARIPGYGNAGEWIKDGAGTLILEDPLLMPSNVHIKAGTVAFASEGYACELFKWHVVAWNNAGFCDMDNGAMNDMFYLGELAFVDPYGHRIGAGSISSAAIGTAPGDLSPGQASFAAETVLMSSGGAGDAGRLFDGNQWPRVGVDSPLLTNECGVTLYVRLPAGSGSVSAINFAAAWGGFPKSWTLSGSVDGGRTWRVLNDVSGYAVQDTASEKWMGAADKGLGGTDVPKAFLLCNTDIDLASPGVRNMPVSMQVRVDAGAVLDFTNVTGGQTVDAVSVDAAGGGTVRNARFADSGTVFLTGVGDGVRIADMSVPLALEDCMEKENLGLWTVCVNGVVQRIGKYRAAYRDGRLYFRGNGLRILLK